MSERMNEMQTFEHSEFGSIRVISQDREPLFISVDVCDALGINNSRDAIARLDDDEKGVVLTDTLGGKQNLSYVNESGLYSLILSSRKPSAKKFKRWVTHDILPSIRKTGMYIAPEKSQEAISDPDAFAKSISDYVKRQLEETRTSFQRQLESKDVTIAGLTKDIEMQRDRSKAIIDRVHNELAILSDQKHEAVKEKERLQSAYEHTISIHRRNCEAFIGNHRDELIKYINRAVHQYTNDNYGKRYIGCGWRDFYVKLEINHGIYARDRKRPYIRHIDDGELACAVRVASAMANIKDPLVKDVLTLTEAA